MQKTTAITSAISLAGCLLMSSAAIAGPQDRGIFAGGNVGYAKDKSVDFPAELERGEADYRAYQLNVGYKYNNWLGVDFRFGNGMSERNFALQDSSNHAEIGIDGISSYYYRPEFTNDEARLYILLGQSSVDLTYAEVDASGNQIGATTSGSVSGLSYGLGAGWYYGDNMTINLEYLMLIDDDEAEISTINLGFDYRFNVWKF